MGKIFNINATAQIGSILFDKCKVPCFIKTGGGKNSTNAESACSGSSLGYCEFSANTNAPNGIGFCKAKDPFLIFNGMIK